MTLSGVVTVDHLPVPEINIEIVRHLYCIETGLRELIIESLTDAIGSRWYRQRLPGDVLAQYEAGRTYERSLRWTEFIPHHPLYYIDFPNLGKVIAREDNWRDAFARYFQRKDVLLATLTGLEPIRNKVAHNRKAIESDLVRTRGAYDVLVNSVGREHMSQLLEQPSRALDIVTEVVGLYRELSAATTLSFECQALPELPEWNRVAKAWWFDTPYLGLATETVSSLTALLEAYGMLPRARGTGHVLEEWLGTNRVRDAWSACDQELRRFLASVGRGIAP